MLAVHQFFYLKYIFLKQEVSEKTAPNYGYILKIIQVNANRIELTEKHHSR